MPKPIIAHVSKSQVDSLEYSIEKLTFKLDSLTLATHDMGIRSSFFGDALAAQTGIFILIVTLLFGALAFISWNTFRRREARIREEFENAQQELRGDFASFSITLEDRMKISEKELRRISYHAAFAIYKYATDKKDNARSLMWLLYICDKMETTKEQIDGISIAYKFLSPDLNQREKHSEIMNMISKLKKTDNDELKESITKFEIRYLESAFNTVDVAKRECNANCVSSKLMLLRSLCFPAGFGPQI